MRRQPPELRRAGEPPPPRGGSAARLDYSAEAASAAKAGRSRKSGARLRVGMEMVVESGAAVPVRGDCMVPCVPEGASVRVEPCPPSHLSPGDVVLVERDGGFVLHRYLATVRVGAERRLLVKPDRRLRPDRAFPSERLVGRLTEIDSGGTVRRYRPGRLERLKAAALGFLWGIVFPFVREARDDLWPGSRR